MPILYIGNTTKQHHEFLYRLPGEAGVKTQRIESGGQARIYNPAPMDVLAYIIKQHEHYGLVQENEVPTTKEFIGLCFSIDRPVDLDRLLHAFDHNNTVMDETAIDRREGVAAAIAAELESATGLPMRNVTVQLKEDVKQGATPRLDTGMEVTRDPSAARHSKEPRRPGGRRIQL